MFPNNYSILRNLFLIAILALTLASCEKLNISREYDEIVIKSPSKIPMGIQDDPHAFMGFNHPDISQAMQLSAGENTQEMQKALDASVVRPPLSWETPNGWIQQKGSGMRLATFKAESKSGPVQCSLISLGGQAGGIESNVLRWMKQIKVQVPGNEPMKKFLSRQEDIITKGEFSIKIINLAEISQDKAPSMIAAIAEIKSMTIFVKMTGSKEATIEQFESFKRLIQSLTLQQ